MGRGGGGFVSQNNAHFTFFYSFFILLSCLTLTAISISSSLRSLMYILPLLQQYLILIFVTLSYCHIVTMCVPRLHCSLFPKHRPPSPPPSPPLLVVCAAATTNTGARHTGARAHASRWRDAGKLFIWGG